MRVHSVSLAKTLFSAAILSLALTGPLSGSENEIKKKGGTGQPQKVVVEYFCCDAVGNCLPANKNSVCPAGYGKVVNKTCEKGERGCDL